MSVKIVGIAGSLRAGSLNAALLRAAVELAPEGVEIIAESIRDVPLYDGDLEAAEGIPVAVTRLKEAVIAADGLLLVTPEYNNGVPGVFKNAIDWMSRPGTDIAKVFGGRPTGLIGASPGGFGTILSQNAWLPILRTLGCNLWTGNRLMVSRAGAAFDDTGKLVNADTAALLARYLAGFAAYCEQMRS